MLYTEKAKEGRIVSEIASLKAYLQETDYLAIKLAEGSLSEKDFEKHKIQRNQWRKEIRDLEAALKEITDGNN